MNRMYKCLLLAGCCLLFAVSALKADELDKEIESLLEDEEIVKRDDKPESEEDDSEDIYSIKPSKRGYNLQDVNEMIEIKSMDDSSWNGARHLSLLGKKPRLVAKLERKANRIKNALHKLRTPKTKGYQSVKPSKYVSHKLDIHNRLLYDTFGIGKPKRVHGIWPAYVDVSVDGSGRVQFSPNVGILTQMQCWMHKTDSYPVVLNSEMATPNLEHPTPYLENPTPNLEKVIPIIEKKPLLVEQKPLLEKKEPVTTQKPHEDVHQGISQKIHEGLKDTKQAIENHLQEGASVLGSVIEKKKDIVEKVAEAVDQAKPANTPKELKLEEVPKAEPCADKALARLRNLESLVEIINLLTKVALDSHGYEDGVLSILVNKLMYTINSTLKQ